jgi:LTXXQ motif family protein
MSKLVVYAVTALLASVPSLAVAQTTMPMRQMQGAQAEAKVLTDIRIDVVKNALQLTPEQQKYWPAIEESMRARADARRQRLENVAARMEDTQPDRDFVKVLQTRADNLSARGSELKKLADAWQPLYATLDDAQKRRMRVLAILVLHGVREGIESRVEEEDMWGSAAVGASTGEGGFGR